MTGREHRVGCPPPPIERPLPAASRPVRRLLRRPREGSALPVLGWKEQAALPDWGIARLRVKLDTGARSSALHVRDLEVTPPAEASSDDPPLVTFHVVLGRGDGAPTKEVTAPIVGFRRVRDTRANPERRPVVRTRLVCGPIDREIDVTVTDRSGMNFRMILGRTALEGSCLVDPRHGYLVSPQPPRRPSVDAGGDHRPNPHRERPR